MFRINDRIILGMIAGTAGTLMKTVIDEISLLAKISQRSFRSTAAGVWVNKQPEAENAMGQLLGVFSDLGQGMLGGALITHLLSRVGKDHVIPKGAFFGAVYGAATTALLSAFPNNKVGPKDAASNLSYMVSHVVYGIVATWTVAKLGSPQIFVAKQANDYLPPTKETSLETQMQAEHSLITPS